MTTLARCPWILIVFQHGYLTFLAHVLEAEERSRGLDVELFILAILVEVLNPGSDNLLVCANVSTVRW